MVIVVPLVIATVVTLWTLEQARLRSKKNRKAAFATMVVLNVATAAIVVNNYRNVRQLGQR